MCSLVVLIDSLTMSLSAYRQIWAEASLNSCFTCSSVVLDLQYFNLYFDLTDDVKQGEYLTAAEIFQELKSHIGSSLKLSNLITFGRKLSQMPSIHRKRFNDGMRYLVVRKL